MKILAFKNSLVTPDMVIKDFSGDNEDMEFFLGIAIDRKGHLEIAYSEENLAKIIGYLEAAKARILDTMLKG